MRTECTNTEPVLFKDCKYAISHDNNCANVDSYKKHLLNVANKVEKLRNTVKCKQFGNIA